MRTIASISQGMPRKTGFTVVELLVCIVIVAVLMTMGILGAQRFREEARAVQCVRKLRDLSVLVHNYARDHDGMLAWYVKGQGGVKGIWWYKVWKHCGLPAREMSKLLTCPSHPDPKILKVGNEEVTFGYRYNKRFGYYNDTGAAPTWTYPLRKMYLAGSPSKVPLLGDSYKMPDNASGFESWPDIWAAHGNGRYGHVAMLDGHVERIFKAPSASEVPGKYNWDADANF